MPSLFSLQRACGPVTLDMYSFSTSVRTPPLRTPMPYTRRHFLSVSLASTATLVLPGCHASRLRPMRSTLEMTDVFVSGNDGYDTYRIPSLLTTPAGTVLAFCEGRVSSRSDSGKIHLLLKRSTNDGHTWSSQQIVWQDGANTCGNPCPVVDHETGRIWLLLTHNLGHDREPEIIDQTSEGTRTVWVTYSDDNGLTWAPPQDITSTTKQDDWTWYATGPGVGIQLQRGPHQGRLVIPCDHIEAGTKRYFSHIIYSDDHGATWNLGGSSPTDQVNECQVVEREDGTLMLNMRNYDPAQRNRALCFSTDGGLTWSSFRHDETLIEPICQASFLRATWPENGKSRLLFSNPASREQRVNMTVRLSYDEGETWSTSRTIFAGPSAYSCLGVLPNQAFGCLFEHGNAHPYERISLARFDLAWLTQNRDLL